MRAAVGERIAMVAAESQRRVNYSIETLLLLDHQVLSPCSLSLPLAFARIRLRLCTPIWLLFVYREVGLFFGPYVKSLCA